MKTLRSVTLRHGFRTMVVFIGKRRYEVEKLTKSSYRRLLAVLNNVPAENRCVELDSDFSPTVYLYFYKLVPMPHLPGGDMGMFPAAHPRQYTLQRKTNLNTTLRPSQRRYLATRRAQIAEHGYSCTDEDVAAAAAVGFTLIPQTWGVRKPLPANPTYNDFRRCW